MIWQSIEMAPKDREFLAYDPVADKFCVCWWDEHHKWFYPTQYDTEFGPAEDDFWIDRATFYAEIERPNQNKPAT